jgi:hypothetical protein
MDLDSVRALHPDLREVESIEDDGPVGEELGDVAESEMFDRAADDGMLREYFVFREGRLGTYGATYDETATIREIVAELELEHGPPTTARSLMGSSVQMWERSAYTLSLLVLDRSKLRPGEPAALLFLKGEPSGSAPLLMLLLGLIGLGLLNVLTAFPSMYGFSSKVRRIQSESDMNHFKRVAARSMYGALVQIVVLVAPNLVFAWGSIAGHLTWADAGPVVVAYVVVLGASMMLKRAESQVQACLVTDELRAEKEHVVEVWRTRPFPKF